MQFTVKQYAQLEKVAERTVRRWLSKGAIPEEDVRRTPGGGIRITGSTAGRVVFMSNGDNRGQFAK